MDLEFEIILDDDGIEDESDFRFRGDFSEDEFTLFETDKLLCTPLLSKPLSFGELFSSLLSRTSLSLECFEYLSLFSL